MDEVALVSSEQQKFQKSVKGIKNLLKSGKLQPRTDKDAKQARIPKREKRQKKKRGLVYISHIPHGFYENQMTQYFRQFGVVTNVRVIRSRRTGRSKGAAFVEFLEPAVAEIVAETMNNYLMGKRLLKAELIPPEKQKTKALRKNWNTQKNPATDLRLKLKKMHNEDGTDEDDLKLARKQLKNVLQAKKKLKDLGIDYDFFEPVEVPLELLPLLNAGTCDVPHKVSKPDKKVKENNLNLKTKESDKEEKTTAGKKNKVLVSETQDNSKFIKKVVKENAKSNKNNKENVKTNEKGKNVNKKEEKKNIVKNKKHNNENTVAEKQLKKNKKEMKFEGQDFIKIDAVEVNEESHSIDESGSNDEFDSDAFEMTIESDDDFDSGDEDGSDDEDGSGDDASEDDESSEDEDGGVDSSEEESPPPKQSKNVQLVSKKAAINKQQIKPANGVQKKTEKRKLEPIVSKKKFQSNQQQKRNKNK